MNGRSESRRSGNGYRVFSHFYNGSEIGEYVEYLQSKYSNIVETEVIGKSIEGRPIHAVKISAPGRRVDGKRPIIFIDAGTHAREWATHMSALHLLQNLVEKSKEHAALLDKVDWIVVPIVNPDGYHFTHETVMHIIQIIDIQRMKLHLNSSIESTLAQKSSPN